MCSKFNDFLISFRCLLMLKDALYPFAVLGNCRRPGLAVLALGGRTSQHVSLSQTVGGLLSVVRWREDEVVTPCQQGMVSVPFHFLNAWMDLARVPASVCTFAIPCIVGWLYTFPLKKWKPCESQHQSSCAVCRSFFVMGRTRFHLNDLRLLNYCAMAFSCWLLAHN